MSGVDDSIGPIPQNHFYSLKILRNTGTEQQKLYAEVLKGTCFGNALAEFKTQNAVQKQTAISSTEHDFVVNGEKFYCTGSLWAAVVPLTLAATPFFARIAEVSLREVDQGLIEAAQAMG